MLRTRSALALALVSTACTGTPAGTWTGQATCGDEDSDGVISAGFDLSKQDDLLFTGPGELSFEGVFEIQGAWRDYAETITYDEVSLELAQPSGAQDVTLTGTADTCVTTIDGDPAGDTCTGGDDLDWVVEWDGADDMALDQGDCTGKLTRD